MKQAEKELAITLRRQGMSVRKIAAQVGVSQGSVSLWVRDVELTGEQADLLKSANRKGQIAASSQRNINSTARIKAYIQSALVEYDGLKEHFWFVFGLALYIGEGDKRGRNVAAFSNCDPFVIRAALAFFLNLMPDARVRCRVHVHREEQTTEAIKHWAIETGLPEEFVKVTVVTTRSSQGTKGNIQPHGTCRIIVCRTELKQKLDTWMDMALGKI